MNTTLHSDSLCPHFTENIYIQRQLKEANGILAAVFSERNNISYDIAKLVGDYIEKINRPRSGQ